MYDIISQYIICIFRASSADEVPIKKLKAEPKDEAEIKMEKELQKNIEKQNKLYHKYRSAMSELSEGNFQQLLGANSQEEIGGFDEVTYSLKLK